MAVYCLSSRISPIGARGHRIIVTATAAEGRSETVEIDITNTIVEAESRRAILLALLEDHLRNRGHEVADLVEDTADE